MKYLLILSILIFISSKSVSAQDEILGQCHLDNGTFNVYQNKSQNILGFKITSGDEINEAIFDRNFVWFWYDVNTAYWKFRNGKHNGVFSWNKDSGIGHLKYVNNDYYYWSLTDCQIDESKIDFP